MRKERACGTRGGRLRNASARQGTDDDIGRGDWIRTSDPLLPKQMRYQAALRPDKLLTAECGMLTGLTIDCPASRTNRQSVVKSAITIQHLAMFITVSSPTTGSTPRSPAGSR